MLAFCGSVIRDRLFMLWSFTRSPKYIVMLLPLQGATTPTRVNPGCRFACPGLGAPLGLQPALAESEWLFVYSWWNDNDKTTTHGLFANCDVVEVYLQVRAEGPMENIAQGKRSDTLGITCRSSRAL